MEGTGKTILLSYDVFLPKGTVAWSGNVLPDELYPQIGIESDDPVLIAKSRSITTGKTLQDARKIYDFVSTWLKWPRGNRVNDSSSAKVAFRRKTGVCSDFARLMTAMLRAAGIPARSVTGLALPQYFNIRSTADWNHQADSHAWVEFFADGRWHFADPSRGGSSHFDRSDGFHLTYDEEQAEVRVYEKCKTLVESEFTSGTNRDTGCVVIGAMSAPLKFVAVASNDRVKMIPRGSVGIDYGYRIPVLLVITLLIILFEVLTRRKIRFTTFD
jgi:hypothetical protein